jgi:predicted RNA-binding Zn-ribbon protein involved in translation (DUF1610 family)
MFCIGYTAVKHVVFHDVLVDLMAELDETSDKQEAYKPAGVRFFCPSCGEEAESFRVTKSDKQKTVAITTHAIHIDPNAPSLGLDGIVRRAAPPAQSAAGDALAECVRVLKSAKLLCNWPQMSRAIDNAIEIGDAAIKQEKGDE